VIEAGAVGGRSCWCGLLPDSTRRLGGLPKVYPLPPVPHGYGCGFGLLHTPKGRGASPPHSAPDGHRVCEVNVLLYSFAEGILVQSRVKRIKWLRALSILLLCFSLILASTGCAKKDKRAPSIDDVSASGITQTSANVAWTTDEPATSQVEFGTTTAYGSSSGLDTSLTTSHTVTLSGLAPGTPYHFLVRSSDERGNEAMSDEMGFNTPLPGANGETVSVNISFKGHDIVGGNDRPIVLLNNKEAVDVTWEYLKQFLLDDQTDEYLYDDGFFTCGDFAEKLHNNAEKAGIKAAFVCLDFSGGSAVIDHAVNAFYTTDLGLLVYIDDTGDRTSSTCSLDKTVKVEVGQPCSAELIFPCPGRTLRALGTVDYFELTW
jgi:hypothetical protein